MSLREFLAPAGEGCQDCHSTRPPRLAAPNHVAPFSWLLTRDVEQGRDELNFSTWDSDDGEADDAADAVAEHSMPPRRYVLVHPDAALSDAERQVLVDALEGMDQSTSTAKCFLRVHAAWSSPSPAGGCWSSANGLPTRDSTWVGVIVRAHRSASATRSTSAWRRWVWVTLRRKARHSHSMRLASGS